MKLASISLAVTLGIVSLSAHAAKDDMSCEAGSQQKYERKAQLQLNDMGLSQRHATFPVTFCPESKSDTAEKKLATAILGGLSGNCIPVGSWKFRIDQSLEDQANDQLIERLAGKRYG